MRELSLQVEAAVHDLEVERVVDAVWGQDSGQFNPDEMKYNRSIFENITLMSNNTI